MYEIDRSEPQNFLFYTLINLRKSEKNLRKSVSHNFGSCEDTWKAISCEHHFPLDDSSMVGRVVVANL